MKVFISIPWFHPAYKAGGPVQSIANMVEQLAVNSREPQDGTFEFWIFCSNKDLDGSTLNVEFDKWVNYSDSTKVWYSSTNNLLPVLKNEIKKERPGYLFITGIYSWQFSLKPLLFCGLVKKIISVRGMLHPGALSQKKFKKQLYLLLWKALGVYKKNIFHATNEEEKKYIEQVFGMKARVMVAANFPHILPLQQVVEKKEGYLKLISVALISPMKNILLVLEALAGAKSIPESGEPGIGNVEYNIYGPIKETGYWKECLELIKKMPANIKVNYHGHIPPAEIVNVVAKNHVFILPSKSENYGHAIYEALAAGRPVITSMNTPWVALQTASAGINVPMDDSTGLQKAIGYFVAMDQDQLNDWSIAAREYALNKVDLDKIRKQYNEMFC